MNTKSIRTQQAESNIPYELMFEKARQERSDYLADLAATLCHSIRKTLTKCANQIRNHTRSRTTCIGQVSIDKTLSNANR